MNLQRTYFHTTMNKILYYKIFHETTFQYSAPASFSHNIAKLKPVDNDCQKLIEHQLVITPNTLNVDQYQDYFGNTATQLFIKESHDKLSVVANSIVAIDVEMIKQKIDSYNDINISLQDLKNYLTKNFDPEVIFIKQFLFTSELIKYPNEEIIDYVKQSFMKYDNIFLAVEDFVQRIFNDFEFVSGFSDIATPVCTIFKEKKGVCQDFASLAIASLRAMGIPTRYASGYIQTIPAEGKEKLFGADASHAWFSVYLGKYGWIDFDPTNNKIPNEEYILLGYGRDYNDITPLKGVMQGSGSSTLSVSVDIALVEDKKTNKLEQMQENQIQQLQEQ